jgi:tetratricopeptide (TPR) repeat protein
MLEDWDGSRKAFEKAFKYEPEEYSYLAMASLAVMKKKDRAESQKYYASAMEKIPSANIYYHILRSFKESGYDAYVMRLIQEQEDKNLQKRLLFYIAELYHELGMESAAYSYFTTVRDIKNLGYYESKIAEHELEKHYE